MHLEVEQHEKEGITVLDLKGKLVLGPEDLLLRERILSLLGGGKRQLILNLGELSRIDSAAIGTLVFCAEKFHEAGGRLVLASLSDGHKSVVDILKAETELESFPDEQDAVNSFFPERVVPHFDVLEFVEEMGLPRGAEKRPEEKK